MLDLFLFAVICVLTTYGITQIYFNSKTFIGLRTMLLKVGEHACDHKSYLLYTISTWLRSRAFVGFCIGILVAATAYVFTFNPQPFNVAAVIVIGVAFLGVGVMDLLADMFPTSRYPEDEYYGHFYPWHEEAEDDSFQVDDVSEDDSEDSSSTSLLEDTSDSSVQALEAPSEEEPSKQEGTDEESSEDAGEEQSETP